MMNAWVWALLVFVGVLAALEFGHWVGGREIARSGTLTSRGVTAIEGAVFALLGLLLAFSFSGAATRFEARRHLITNEVNAIGTAWLLLDLLPVETQPQLRDFFRSYADLRASFSQGLLNDSMVEARVKAMAELQERIWRGVLDSSQAPTVATQTPMLLLPALTSMFDIASTRYLATQNHPPRIISTLLSVMTFLAAILAG